MLQKAIDLQRRAVEDLKFISTIKNDIVFRAPTGSGKTYMMAKYMNDILAFNKDVVFVVACLSTSDLGGQNYEKFREYSLSEFNNLNPYKISSEYSPEETPFIPSGYNCYVLSIDLYKKKSILKESGAFLNFLITTSENKKIYLIKDECHRQMRNIDDLSTYWNKTIMFSATPNLSRGQNPDVTITDDEAVQAKLIKDIEYGESDIDVDKVKVAIDKYLSITDDYINLLDVNPCMIIQISNSDEGEKQASELIELLKADYHDLEWMYIVDNPKECDTNNRIKLSTRDIKKWKEIAKDKRSDIDIIIFKMSLAEGWDIPRACMLYQIRDSKSTQLDEQVMGRIRRNPRLMDFEDLSSDAQELAMKAWVWGIYKEKFRPVAVETANKKIIDEFKIKSTKVHINNRQQKEINEYMIDKKSPDVLSGVNIFSLYRDYSKGYLNVKLLADEFINDYQDWIKFAFNINGLNAKIDATQSDYENSMIIDTDENGKDVLYSINDSFFVEDSENYERITDWIWKRSDGKDIFGFDSFAEKKWFEELLSLSDSLGKLAKSIDGKFLVGKNYYPNSKICFEYWKDGSVHQSYPDFIMKTRNDKIWMFESKSVNYKENSNIDPNEYNEKIEYLKKCYLRASELTGYRFCIPILINDTWWIWNTVKNDYSSIDELCRLIANDI